MSIHLRQNVYNGVNAHLHSVLQNELGGWEVFHGAHITHLAEAIDVLLPAGYLVDPEKSMQIRQYHPDSGEPIEETWKPRPDLTIYETVQRSQSATGALGETAPTLTLSATASVDLDEQSYLRAIVIREVTSSGDLGQPVTWIELLSPTNKPPNSGYRQYREKRNATIQAGLALVEIDYLHETRSPILSVASYPDHNEGAFPYTIVVTNPRPNLNDGVMKLYGFGVDMEMPRISIPLAGEDSITLDTGVVYHRTFHSLASFSRRVDYSQPPVRMETYHAEDQERIKAVMGRAAQTMDTLAGTSAGDT